MFQRFHEIMDKKSGKKIKELHEQQAITEALLFYFSHRLRRDDALPSLISKEAYRPMCETILDF